MDDFLNWARTFLTHDHCYIIRNLVPRLFASYDGAGSHHWELKVCPNSQLSFYHFNLLRLADDDEGAAPTGVEETTMEATSYPHPSNDKITFWDLPGVGMNS
jgi:hypothetical protein